MANVSSVASKVKSKYTLPKNHESKALEERKFTHLYLHDKSLYNITSLSAYENLSVLYLHNNEISKIENLEHLKNLTSLYLQKNRIRKIENLGKLSKIRKLYLGHNEINVLEGLQSLEQLEELHMEKQNLREGDSLCFDPRSVIVISKSLRVLNISGNNISTLLYLIPLRFLNYINAGKNALSNVQDVCDTITGWYYLKEAVFDGNPICKTHRWKESIIAATQRLTVLDNKEIGETTRFFIQKFELEKAKYGQKNINLANHFTSLPTNHPAPLQKAVSASIIREIKTETCINSDISDTSKYVPWRALPETRIPPSLKSAQQHIRKKKQVQHTPKKLSVTFLCD